MKQAECKMFAKKERAGTIKLGKGTADKETDGKKRCHRLICEHTLRVFLRRNNNELLYWKKEWNYILFNVMKTTVTKPDFTGWPELRGPWDWDPSLVF